MDSHFPTPPSGVQTQGSQTRLALLGGAPAFDELVGVGRPNLPDRAGFLQRLESIFDSRRLTNLGPQVQEFEERVAQLAGTRHCVATCNATVALELAVRALGMEGDVIVPSFTFVADAHALWWQRIRPVFCDVDGRTHCLDPRRVEAAITPRTTGILAVHLWGNACDVEALSEIADRRGLKLLYDAAHALGCTARGRPIASFGDASVLSFHATKLVNAFEGGAIVTDDGDLANRLRLMTNFGFSDEDQVEHLGINGKMSEPSAAMGLTSLELLDEIVAHNRANHDAYARCLADVPGVELVELDEREQHNWHYVVALVDPDRCPLTRDQLVGALRFENVVARRYFHPGCHRVVPYVDMAPLEGGGGDNLRVTEELTERVMVLPTGQTLEVTDVERLCGRIAAAVGRAPEVRAALAASTDPRLPDFLRSPGFREGPG